MEEQDYIYDNKIGNFVDVEPYKKERVGSDGTWFVDQRYNIDSVIRLAEDYIKKHNFEFYEIRNGDLDNFSVLYKNY